MPFKNWKYQHYLDLLIFIGGLATAISSFVPDTWAAIPAAMTPKVVLGLVIAASGYAKSVSSDRPRDASVGTRRSDPFPTAPVAEVDGQAVPMPPVTAGRPVDPDAPKETP
jgi:hypothetical protein